MPDEPSNKKDVIKIVFSWIAFALGFLSLTAAIFFLLPQYSTTNLNCDIYVNNGSIVYGIGAPSGFQVVSAKNLKLGYILTTFIFGIILYVLLIVPVLRKNEKIQKNAVWLYAASALLALANVIISIVFMKQRIKTVEAHFMLWFWLEFSIYSATAVCCVVISVFIAIRAIVAGSRRYEGDNVQNKGATHYDRPKN